MTRIYAGQQGKRCILTARGHATGSVAVCAAISGIVYALAGYLVNAQAEKRVEILTQRLESGDAALEFLADAGAAEAFSMAVIGLLQIQKAHPELVLVEGREKTEKSCGIRGEKEAALC